MAREAGQSVDLFVVELIVMVAMVDLCYGRFIMHLGYSKSYLVSGHMSVAP